MKQIFLIAWLVVIVSLACLSTAALDAADGEHVVVSTRTATFVKVVGVPTNGVVVDVAQDPERCAVVVADLSLHLRSGPSADDVVLTWLRSGEVVQVLSDYDRNWWRVRYQDFDGFARSMYLEFADCEVRDEYSK